MSQFVHLHLHTEYSLLDGAARIDRLFDCCKKNNMDSVAITDHGNMFGVYEFYLKAKAQGIKPIIGCEVYVVDNYQSRGGHYSDNKPFHLVLLAKNNTGYKNLVKLDSIAYIDGFYYKPRIDFSLLEKYHEGLICLSACIGGQLPQYILNGQIDDAKALVKKYKDLFKDDYYIEIQDHNLPEQKQTNPIMISIAKEFDIPLVVTNDVHYIERRDSEMQDVLMCVQTGKRIDDENRMKFPNDEFYFKSKQEMEEIFPYLSDAIENTYKIAQMCNVEIKREQLLPNYIPEDGKTPYEFLKSLLFEGLKNRYDILTDEIVKRAEYELEVINRMGFIEYYLIVWDFIHYAESIGIPVGPGRGSGAGSIIAYALGITKIEPLRFKLLFERFLNPERVSMPDFDIDFCVDRRGEVIEYVIQKYGKDNVAQIVTFGTMAAKAAVKDVARVLNVSIADVTKVTKLIPLGKTNLKEALGIVKPIDKKTGVETDNSILELIEIYKNDLTMHRVLDLAMSLEGQPRNTSMHAAGVVICKYPISDYIPLQRNGNDITTQYNMTQVEKLGLLKMDFLGLRTLTDVDKTIKLVKETTGKIIDFSKETYSDPKVFELISSGDTDAVFQLESPGMKRTMQELSPRDIEDIIAGISLYRPGPMAEIPKYIEGKNHPERVKYDHIKLEPILKVTHGCMVYQEQVMQIVQDLAGFSLGGADVVRRAMGHKDKDEMKRQEDLFVNGKLDNDGNILVDGCLRRGVDETTARIIFEKMQAFAEYAFNKSHATAYAVVAYQTAYLKKYHIVEFLAAVLNNRITNSDEVKKYVGYCIEKNIKVLPPDINSSNSDFSVEDGKVRFGMGGVKNVGIAAINKIVEERNLNGKFKDLLDFASRVEGSVLNKRLIESLIKAGAFDSFNVYRSQLMAVYENVLSQASIDRKQKESGQFSMFEMVEQSVTEINYPNIKEYNSKYKLGLEKEVLGIYLTGNPLDEYKEKLKQYNFNTSFIETRTEEDEMLGFEDEIQSNYLNNKRVSIGGILTGLRKVVSKTNNKVMVFGKLEDLYGSIEVAFYPRVYDKLKNKIEEDSLVGIRGTLHLNTDEPPKISVEDMELWSNDTTEGNTVNEINDGIFYIKLPYKSDDLYDKILSVIDNYVGECSCILVIEGKKLMLEEKVRFCNGINIELGELVGKENIKYIKRGN